MLLHFLRNYRSRMGWEIVIFWLLSIASSIAMTGDSSAAICLGLARLEIIGVIWITVRLLIAEEGFKTSGGWQARPIPGWAPLATQIIVLGIAFILPMIVRVLLLRHQLGMDTSGWGLLVKRVWWPQALIWLIFATAVKLAAHSIMRGSQKMQFIAWSAFVILIMVGTHKICSRAIPTTGHDEIMNISSGPGALAQGIQRLLPTASDFVGAWNDRLGQEGKLPAAKLVLRLPVGSVSPLINSRLLASEATLLGARAAVKIQLRSSDTELIEKLLAAPAILKYSDGTYGTCRQERRYRNRGLGPRPEVEQFDFYGSFVSPLCLPEYEGDPSSLLAGAELLFFEKDPEAAPLEPILERVYGRPSSNQTNLTLPPVNTPEDPDPLAASTYQLIDWLNLSWDFSRNYTSPAGMEEQIQSLPAAALPFVLRRFPWSKNAWDKLVHPFLLKHSAVSEIPQLLDRLEFDPRLGVLFIEKGWTRDAMPLLRRFAKDRLPLESACVRALAEQQDPALAADLAVVALQIDRDLAELESPLRNYPDFDWASFVKAGWKNCKYQRLGYRQSNFELYRLWAAQVGDYSAFRALAEAMANDELRNKTDAMTSATAIIAGEHPNLIAYLRENIDRMTFDPQMRKWR